MKRLSVKRFSVKQLLVAVSLLLAATGSVQAFAASPEVAPRAERKTAQLQRQAERLRKSVSKLGRHGAPASPLLQKVQRRLRLVEKRLTPRSTRALPH